MRALGIIALVLGGVGCAARTPPESFYVAQAHRLQLHADQALAAGSPDEARDALLQTALLAPPTEMPATEVMAIREDAYARLSTLELARGKPAEALTQAQRGLDLGSSQDVLEAALFVARGKASEAMGHDADAAADYDRAIRVDEALLTQEPDREGTP